MSVVRVYRRNAKKRSIEWDIDTKEFIKIIQMDCVYCGAKPSSSAQRWDGSQQSKDGSGDFVFNGADRVNNSKGYITGNVVACCKVCNYLKGQLSQEELLWQIAAIVPRLVTLLIKKSQ